MNNLDLSIYGITGATEIVHNPSYEELFVAETNPALGTLISTAGTEDVAAAYAATYPIALIAVVLVSQFIIILF